MINGKKIRELREARGISVSEFARRVYITQPHASALEVGARQASVDALTRIAKFFGCLVDDLIMDETT